MKFQKKDHLGDDGFQLAPMIDIVFLLLIFFIVTWQFSRAEVDLKVDVPTSTQGEEREKRFIGEIIVNVRDDGSITVNGAILSDHELQGKLTSLAKVHANQPIRIRGASSTPYQRIVEVIDICQIAGIWNISFATQKPQN